MRVRHRFRPRFLPESLESRVVPSHAAAHVAAAATSATSQQAALAAAGGQVDAAYANFAAAIRQAELDEFPTGATTKPADEATVTTGIKAASGILASEVGAALGAVPGVSAGNAALIAAGIGGSGPGSLATELTGLFAAEESFRDNAIYSTPAQTPGGPTYYGIIGDADREALGFAVEDALASSLLATSVQGFLAASAGSAQSSTASTNLATIASVVNPAYATFAAAVRQATGLIQPGVLGTGPDAIPGSTIPALQTSLTAASTTLEQTLTTSLAGTRAAAASGLLQAQLDGQPGSLADGIGALTAIIYPVTADNHYYLQSGANLDLPVAAYDLAIAASYQSIGIDGYLIGTSRALSGGS